MQGAGVFVSCLITFSMFPGVTDLSDSSLSFVSYSWSLILYALLFNLCDTTGRFLPSLIKLFTPNTLPILTIARSVFIATFILNYKLDGYLFGTNWFKIVNICLLGVTNGYAQTLHMMFGPELVANKLKTVAGFIMSTHIQFGCFIASMIAEFVIDTYI